MCSYQNISNPTNQKLSNENWEEILWANILSPNTNESDTNSCEFQLSETAAIQNVSAENEITATTFQNIQMQICSNGCQNVDSSSLLSPPWEDSAFDVPQNSANMSTYFSTFNPASQVQDIPIHQTPVLRTSLNVWNQNTTANRKKMHQGRISFVATGNGNFKAIVKRKRKRTVFTTEQLEMLEEVFSKKHYITRDERQLLVEKLQVNDKSVKVWFQNRRIKNKRDDQDEIMQADSTCTKFERLDIVESEIIKRTDELGFVTLDDKIMNDLANVINDYFLNNDSPVDTATEVGSSPIYEPISPASPSDHSGDENSMNWQYNETNYFVQELIDLESMISK